MNETPHMLERSRDTDRALKKLVDDVKILSADARELLRHTAEQSGERLSMVRDRARDTLEAVEARLGPMQHALAERGRQAAEFSTRHVRAHPWSTIAAVGALALAIAAMVAWQSEQQRGERREDY